MREIKFRGKAIMSIEELELMGIEHDNGWVYGNLIKNGNRPMITADILEEIDESIYPRWWAVVEPKSVGQYTGLKDKNGKEIYEGDIILFNNFGDTLDKVVYSPGCFHTSRGGYLLDKIREIEIIGNIYEHPELLEGKK